MATNSYILIDETVFFIDTLDEINEARSAMRAYNVTDADIHVTCNDRASVLRGEDQDAVSISKLYV